MKEHRKFVEDELWKMIPDESFASYVAYDLANELQSILDAVEEEQPDSYWQVSPAEGLFSLLDDGWSLDIEDLRWTDGIYRDDCEEDIPESVVRQLSAAQQMAVYGLLILENDHIFDDYKIQEHSTEHSKLSPTELIEFRTDALLEAYQALVFAQKLQQKHSTETGNKSRKTLVDFSALGASGAKVRHAPMAEVRKWAISLYREKTWPSANAAAFELADQVVKYAREIGANLSPFNAQRTIAEWIRKSV